MADTPTFMPNPYGNFDPSQWSNPYSLYQNQALPWPTQYAGTPTDAYGRPIQSYLQAQAAAQAQPAPAPAAAPQGMTLNSMPQDLSARWRAQQQAIAAANPDPANAALLQAWAGTPGQMNYNAPPPQQAAPAAPAAPAGPDMSAAYLAALANPGRVTTPGATVPPSATAYQPSSGVLQQFLASWQPAAAGPGSGFQQGFNRALRSS
jgi:hypothetical protein